MMMAEGGDDGGKKKSRREVEFIEEKESKMRKQKPGAISSLRRRIADLAEMAAKADSEVEKLLGVEDLNVLKTESEKLSLMSESERRIIDDVNQKKLIDIISKQCVNIVRTISNHKWAWPFLEPVDPVRLNIPEYTRIIKVPSSNQYLFSLQSSFKPFSIL